MQAYAAPADGGLAERLRGWLPKGNSLPAEDWRRRHAAMLVLLWLHVVALPSFGLAVGASAEHAIVEGALIAVLAALATPSTFRGRDVQRRFRGAMAALGLITCSAVLVHLSGGYIEAHFHFFVMIIVLSLYEDWVPFLMAVGYVVLHHGAMGAVDPEAVYNHPDAVRHPWKWALIHAGFVAAAGAAAIVAWRLNELVRIRAADADARALERSRHAEELERREEATRRIIDSAHEGYIQIDEDSVVLSWNVEAETTFGYSREEAIGRQLPELIIPEQHRPAHYTGLQRFLQTGDGPVLGRRLELPALHRDGHEFPVEITISALRDGDESWRFHAFLHDISERKELEAAVRQAEELERRRRQAYEINDSVVQRLAVAKLAFEMGRGEQAVDAVTDALSAAKRIINEWAGENPHALQRLEPERPPTRNDDG